jgi:hypothetical protein
MRTLGWLLKRKGGWRSILARNSQRSRHLLKIVLMFVRAGSANSTWFNSYHPYTDHLQFLNDLQSAYPSNSEIVVAGNSDAGRPITGVHFYGSGGVGSKAMVASMLENGSHLQYGVYDSIFASKSESDLRF